MIKTAIVEDTREAREGLRYLLGMHRDIRVIADFSNAETLISRKDLLPQLDVILMDIGLPGINGIKATRIIKEKFPEIDILILTIFEDHEKIMKAIQAGASGYLLKNNDPGELADQIRSLRHGGSPISPNAARTLLTQIRLSCPPQRNTDYHLTAREKEILIKLVDGNTYREIADDLEIAGATVKKHILHIYRKLDVSSRTEFVRKVLQEKLLEVD